MTIGAVVVGGRLPALSTVRALGSRGIPVAVIATSPTHIAQFSRWGVERHDLLQFPQHPESLLELLDRQRPHWRDWVVYATDDQALEILSRNRSTLSDYRVAAPPWEVTRRLLRKDLLHETAGVLGVPTPTIYGYARPPMVADTEVRYPVLVKPVESHLFARRFDRKLFAARDPTELAARIADLEGTGLEAQVVEYIPGPDSEFYNYSLYLDDRGEVLAELGMRKLRKSPPFFGVCRVGEVADVPELREPTLRILRHIGWRGMANAEFKRDPRDGRFRLIEINGRCFLMQGLAMAAGIDYPHIAWQELVEGRHARIEPRSWDGVWINLIEDLYYLLAHRRSEGLSVRQYAVAWLRPKTFAIWSRDDPKPFLWHCGFGVRKVARMVTNRSYRAQVAGRVQPVRRGPGAAGEN
jgi:D-aspartate ligase